MRAKLFGYFDDDTNIPTYDPGLDVVCPICDQPLTEPMRSTSFIDAADNRSYFIRVHRDCDELHPEILDEIVGMMLDAVHRSKESN